MFAIAKILLTLASEAFKYLKNKELMDAGAADSILKGLRDADDAINRARAARANADSVPTDADPNNRDNWE